MNKEFLYFLTISFLTFFAVGGCSSSGGSCPETTVSLAVCDTDTGGPFSLTIDNDFFPLEVGTQIELTGDEDRVVITVLDETEEVADVTTRVVEEREFESDELVEVSRNFFAQAPDGTVCYFGEEVDIYSNGEIVSSSGAWRAGENGSSPGIMMPANPEVGMVYSQENAPGIAEDRAEVLATGETITVPLGTYTDTITMDDCNPLENGSKDRKYYVRDIGLAIDEDEELTSFE